MLECYPDLADPADAATCIIDGDSFQVIADAPQPVAHSTLLHEESVLYDAYDSFTLIDTPPGSLATSTPPAAAPGNPGRASDSAGSRALRVSPYEFPPWIAHLWPSKNSDICEPCFHLDAYERVKATNLPNYLSARIPIPSHLNCDAWEALLTGYHNAEITDFIRYGWPGGYTAPEPPHPSEDNHPSAT